MRIGGVSRVMVGTCPRRTSHAAEGPFDDELRCQGRYGQIKSFDAQGRQAKEDANHRGDEAGAEETPEQGMPGIRVARLYAA